MDTVLFTLKGLKGILYIYIYKDLDIRNISPAF